MLAHKPGPLSPRLWFSLDLPVTRQDYIVAGLVLMEVKYALEIAVVWLTTGRSWPLAVFLSPIYQTRA